jgi:hypothetical protein
MSRYMNRARATPPVSFLQARAWGRDEKGQVRAEQPTADAVLFPVIPVPNGRGDREAIAVGTVG